VEETICEAIRARSVIQFHYSAGGSPGLRVVEPHQVGVNVRGNPALSAWFLRGESDSDEGWREYLLESVERVTVLSETFAGPRPGYSPHTRKLFRRVRCEL